MSEKGKGEYLVTSEAAMDMMNFAAGELLTLVGKRTGRDVVLAVLALRATEKVCLSLAKADEEDIEDINRIVGAVMDLMVIVPKSALPAHMRDGPSVFRVPLPPKDGPQS